jgi:PadR family transcriptional regulator PadR
VVSVDPPPSLDRHLNDSVIGEYRLESIEPGTEHNRVYLITSAGPLEYSRPGTLDLVNKAYYGWRMSRESIGEFEQLILLAILRLGDDAYGVPILEEIRRHSRRKILRPAVYVALGRLEEKGLVTSRTGDGGTVRRGRPRRYFEVSAEGITQLREARDTLLSMWEGLQAVLTQG